MNSNFLRRSKEEKHQSMNTTKIVVGTKKDTDLPTVSNRERSSPTNATPSRKQSYFSPIYGKLIDSTEAEELCKQLGMNRNDVRQLRRKFDEEDGSHSDTVTLRGFVHLLNDDKAFERSQLIIKELLRLANIKPSIARVTFDQYLRVVCTFASFTEPQLWRFFYDAYCASETDFSDSRRLGALLHAAGGSYAHNIEVAARQVAANSISHQTGITSSLSFEDFLGLVHRNPAAFFPFIRMQRIVRTRTLGEKYWARKAREQLLLQPLMGYLRLHRGCLPRMGFKYWVMSILLGGNTVMAHARALAKRQYLEESAKKV